MFIIIVLAAIMGLIGTDLFAPSLPHIAQAFHQTQNYTQLTISLYLMVLLFRSYFMGRFLIIPDVSRCC